MRLQDCQLSVYKPNPRQYVATISQVRSNTGFCRCPRLGTADLAAGMRSAWVG